MEFGIYEYTPGSLLAIVPDAGWLFFASLSRFLACWSMIFFENRCPARIKSGPGFSAIMLERRNLRYHCGVINP
jgi:hypothetical protein